MSYSHRADLSYSLMCLWAIAFTCAIFTMGSSAETDTPAPNFPSHTSAAVQSFGPFRSSALRNSSGALSTTFPSWTTSQLSQGRALLVSVSLPAQGLVFFAGGWNFQSQSSYSNVDIYNAQTNQWSTALLSAARVKFSAASLSEQGLAMFAGGFNGSPDQPNVLSSIDVYNAIQGSWSTAVLSVARLALAATSLPHLCYTLDWLSLQAVSTRSKVLNSKHTQARMTILTLFSRAFLF